jgi:dolichyl-phosphate beta-glucosyltransferase
MIKSLSIILPVYNEQLRLKSAFSNILNFLKRKHFKTEIIFVDDGSTDNSFKMINNFIEKFKKKISKKKIRIKIIKSENNLGKGSALKLGVKNAKFDWILTADIDMSVSLSQINIWLQKKLINKEHFVYIASRTHKKSIVKRNLFRNILGLIMRFFIFGILNIKIKDTQCGFKLYKKKVAKFIFLKLKDCGFSHDIELILLLKNKKIKIKELPIRWIHKKDGKLNLFWDPIKMLYGIFIAKFRYL